MNESNEAGIKTQSRVSDRHVRIMNNRKPANPSPNKRISKEENEQ